MQYQYTFSSPVIVWLPKAEKSRRLQTARRGLALAGPTGSGMNAAVAAAARERRLQEAADSGDTAYLDAASARQAHLGTRAQLSQIGQTFVMVNRPEHLSWPFRCWLFLEHPTSSLFARMWSTVITFTILLSSFTFVINTLPQYHTQGPHTNAFYGIEVFSITIFTLEYVARWSFYPVAETSTADDTAIIDAGAAEDGELGSSGMLASTRAFVLSRLRFMRKVMNIIDLLAILPFYIEAIYAALSECNPGEQCEQGGAGGLAVLRVVRITRIFRLLKLGKHNDGMEILVQTMQASYSFLVSVVFLMLIITVLFASIVFFFETDSNSCLASWECVDGQSMGADCTLLTKFECHAIEDLGELCDKGFLYVNWTREEQAAKQSENKLHMFKGAPRAISPSGALIPHDSIADDSKCKDVAGRGECKRVGNICFNSYGMPTSFNSIPNSIWWCLVTMCCVGFGDMVPVTVGGKVFGVFTALTGVVVLAMPTTVIGTNFSEIYEDYYARKRLQSLEDAEGEQESVADDDAKTGLPEELMGTNSKHLNRLIVEKQLAAQAKTKGIPQDVIDLAFMNNSEVGKERERVLQETMDAFKKELTSELCWIKFRENTRASCVQRVSEMLRSRRGGERVGEISQGPT